jgi:hypothetical protein
MIGARSRPAELPCRTTPPFPPWAGHAPLALEARANHPGGLALVWTPGLLGKDREIPLARARWGAPPRRNTEKGAKLRLGPLRCGLGSPLGPRPRQGAANVAPAAYVSNLARRRSSRTSSRSTGW